MFKKMMLVGSMALAALAFAIPVSAASANWTHGEGALTEDAGVSFTGPANFSVGEGAAGADAEIYVEATLKAGTTTAEITKFEDTSCIGTGQLAGLTCTGTAIGLPWTAQIEGDDILIEDIHLTTGYWSPLQPNHSVTPVAQTTLEGDILAKVDNPFGISIVELEGQGTTANGNPAVVEGELEVSPAGTYGTT